MLGSEGTITDLTCACSGHRESIRFHQRNNNLRTEVQNLMTKKEVKYLVIGELKKTPWGRFLKDTKPLAFYVIARKITKQVRHMSKEAALVALPQLLKP